LRLWFLHQLRSLAKGCFAGCVSLTSPTFESGSRLSRIENWVCHETKIDWGDYSCISRIFEWRLLCWLQITFVGLALDRGPDMDVDLFNSCRNCSGKKKKKKLIPRDI
jgi:hypothetical protein